MLIDRKSIPIPARMQKLERDKRGYPIPVNVLRDANGDPHFTVNDERVAEILRTRGLCAISGYPMVEGGRNNMWFVGGVASAFHRDGAFFDSPMLKDCARYALQVCPYLAMPSYGRRIDGKTVDRAYEKLAGKEAAPIVLQDNTQMVERPAVFILAKTTTYKLSRHAPPGALGVITHIHPKRPWLEVEFWADGKQIDGPTAWGLVEAERASKPDGRYLMEDLIHWPEQDRPQEYRNGAKR